MEQIYSPGNISLMPCLQGYQQPLVGEQVTRANFLVDVRISGYFGDLEKREMNPNLQVF